MFCKTIIIHLCNMGPLGYKNIICYLVKSNNVLQTMLNYKWCCVAHEVNLIYSNTFRSRVKCNMDDGNEINSNEMF